METRDNLHIIMVNPSAESIASVPDSLKPITLGINGDNIAETFHSVLTTHTKKYNLLIDGRFGIYSAENIEKSIRTMDTGPYAYGIYGIVTVGDYWMPQVLSNPVNTPFLLRDSIVGQINFANIKNVHVYHSLLAQMKSLIGADFCYPGIKLCQNQ